MTENQVVELSSFFGLKTGMTRIFDQDGNSVPVTVVKLIPNFVSQIKTKAKDGYDAYQVAYYNKREKLIGKPSKGHLAKAQLPGTLARFSEIKVSTTDESHLGKQVSYNQFSPSTFVDVTGLSKGHGFQGVMKKYNFQGGPASHGSTFHRRPGSIGNRATPARVFPEKKMPGHMGVETCTIQNLKVVEVNVDEGYMLIKGSIPGAKNGFVRISHAMKKKAEK